MRSCFYNFKIDTFRSRYRQPERLCSAPRKHMEAVVEYLSLSQIIGLAFWCLHSLMSIDFHVHCLVCHQTVDKSLTRTTKLLYSKWISATMARCQCDTRSTFLIFFSLLLLLAFVALTLRRSGKVEQHIPFYLFPVLLLLLPAIVVAGSVLTKYIGLVWLTRSNVWP